MSTMDNETDVLAVHAIPVIVQEEDIVCPTPNCHEGQNGVGLTLNNDRPLTGSRPSSQLSQNGSSGYGSTRSQVGPFGTSNRPSPASSSSSSSSSTNSNSEKKTANNNNNTNSKPKRSVWFGGGSKGSSLARAQRAASAEPEPETVMSEPEVTAASSKTRGGPQYASLRIPNRIRPHGGSHGELSSFEDRGLDLAEAEVDSDVEVERGPMPAPRGHNPLRHANSLETQVRFFFFLWDKANQYQF